MTCLCSLFHPFYTVIVCIRRFFDKMYQDPDILCHIEFNKGLPSLENINALDNGWFHMIILDDLMEIIVQSEDMRDLFTMYCHHKNITTIMVSQNPFLKGKHLHMISINTQINHLAHQLFQKGSMRMIPYEVAFL